MIPEVVSAVLLTIPLITMIIPSISYWSKFKKEKRKGESCKKANYKKSFFYLLVVGVLCMWVAWVGGIISLFLKSFHSILGCLTFSSSYKTTIQILGFTIFYIGAITYNMNVIVAGKYLRPAPSGTLETHRLIKKGPFAVIRHPLYVSYILILAGLCLVLLCYYLFIPTFFIITGIYPTAKVEEDTLIEQFEDDYIKYKQQVGMFFPRFGKV